MRLINKEMSEFPVGELYYPLYDIPFFLSGSQRFLGYLRIGTLFMIAEWRLYASGEFKFAGHPNYEELAETVVVYKDLVGSVWENYNEALMPNRARKMMKQYREGQDAPCSQKRT